MGAITEAPPRELLAVAYTQTGVSTSTATHGAAMDNAWGGQFTVGSRSSVDIEISIPYMNVASAAGVFVEAHILVNNDCKGNAFVPHITVGAFTGLGFSAYRKLRLTGLTPGDYTIAVQVKVGTAVNGTITASSANPGLLRVVEV